MATEGFAAVPNWIIREADDLDVYAIAVYAALASYSGKGGIYPSQQTLAHDARCSERKVRDALRALEDIGVVRRESTPSRTGRSTDRYFLTPNGDGTPPARGAGTPPARDAGSTGTVCRSEPARGAAEEEPPEEEPLNKNPPTPQGAGVGSEVAALSEGSKLAPLMAEHLAAWIEHNGSKRPAITKRWLDAARLLVDADGRDPAEVRTLMDWSQRDEFWRANILSLPKFREKYDQLRLAASRGNPKQTVVDRGKDLYEEALRREAEQERNGGTQGAIE